VRSIKFRGWHVVQKKMFSPEEMHADGLAVDPGGRNFVNVSGVSTKLNTYSDDTMIPLQFTGLKDKNGDEIYEDDLVKIIDDSEEGLFHCVWNEYHACFEFRHVTQYKLNSYCLGGAAYQRIEVVGNVHQNPEILA